MTQDQLIIVLFKVVLLGAEIGALSFAAVYTALAPWWKNELGKTIVRLDLLLAAAVLPSVLSLFFHFSRLTSHVAAWIDIVIFGLIAIELFRRIPLWIRFHKEKAAREGGREGDPV